MTTRFKSPARFPTWPQELAGFATAAPTLTGAIATLAAANDRLILIGVVRWQDGQTHNLRSIKWRSGTATGANFTLRVSIRAIDAANGPVGRDDGAVIQSGTHVNPASNTVFNTQMSADTSYAHGANICIVRDFSAYTAGSLSFVGMTPGTFSQGHRPLQVYYNGSVYAVVANGRMAGITLIADDGTLGVLEGALPCLTAITTNTFNTGTAAGSGVGDEVGYEFTVDTSFVIDSMGFMVNPAASADFDVVLYEGTTQKASFSVDANTHQGNGLIGWVRASFPAVTLTTGQTYRLVIKPTTANNVSIYSVNFDTAGEAALAAGLPSAGLNSRADAGAWQTVVSTRLPFCDIGIIGLEGGGQKRLVGASPLVN